MSRARRVVAMVSASLAVLALGFVVAVSASSLPGSAGDEPLLDLDLRTDLDLRGALAWLLLILAVIGAVLFVSGVRQAKPREEPKRRSLLALLAGVVLFVVLYQWLRPAVEAIFGEVSSVAESPADPPGDGPGPGSGSGWLFSVLLAAVIAAALTRIGISVRSVGSPFATEAAGDRIDPVVTPAPLQPGGRALGHDPRSRILQAYQEFEDGLERAGHPRPPAETTGRHALRAGGRLNLDRNALRGLVSLHGAARYAPGLPTSAEAEAAERASSSLRERLLP